MLTNKMEHVGTLPETNNVLSPIIIPLFGILSLPAEKDEDCHICYEKITKGHFLVAQLPCCRHYVHTVCFKTWASTSHAESTVCCAYCRTKYVYKDKCFLCLNNINSKNLKCTNCCHTTVHSKCSKDLTDIVTLLTFDHSLECGQLVDCNCLWLDI